MKPDIPFPEGMFYKLNKNRDVVPCRNFTEWMEFYYSTDRTVARDVIGNVRVVTTFLSVDHRGIEDEGGPLVFETVVRGGVLNLARQLYSTWGDAERGHKEMVEKVQESAQNKH